MLYTEEGKILINNLFSLKAHNSKHLVREFPSQRLERRPCLPVVAKTMGYWVGRPLFWQQQMMKHPHSW